MEGYRVYQALSSNKPLLLHFHLLGRMRISTGLDIEETKPTRGIIAFCLWTPWPVSGRAGWTRVQWFQFELHRVNAFD